MSIEAAMSQVFAEMAPEAERVADADVALGLTAAAAVFANPWHDQLGRFADKGTGRSVATAGVQATGSSPAPAPTEGDARFAERYGNERPSGDGDCFPAAFNVLVQVRDQPDADRYRLVHGVPTGQGEIAGLRFDHAWVERSEPVPESGPWTPAQREQLAQMMVTVIDRSNGNDVELPRQLYYKVGDIHERDVKRYTIDEAFSHAVASGNYGPWDD